MAKPVREEIEAGRYAGASKVRTAAIMSWISIGLVLVGIALLALFLTGMVGLAWWGSSAG